MRRSIAIWAVLAAGLGWFATGAAPADAAEFNSNRRGGDYRNFWVPQGGHRACASACARERSCRAWTYVRPGVQGRQGRCWLKRVTPRRTADNCCISGVKGGVRPPTRGYYARWRKVGGPGGPWASRWAWYGPQFIQRYGRPVCGHGAACNCRGQNYCRTGYTAGQRVPFWARGCNRAPWIVRCEIRRR